MVRFGGEGGHEDEVNKRIRLILDDSSLDRLSTDVTISYLDPTGSTGTMATEEYHVPATAKTD